LGDCCADDEGAAGNVDERVLFQIIAVEILNFKGSKPSVAKVPLYGILIPIMLDVERNAKGLALLPVREDALIHLTLLAFRKILLYVLGGLDHHDQLTFQTFLEKQGFRGHLAAIQPLAVEADQGTGAVAVGGGYFQEGKELFDGVLCADKIGS
jgi:hypothetical protein